MPKITPAFPENPTVEQLQSFYEKAVDSRYISSNHDDHAQILLNLQLQVALLGNQVQTIRRQPGHDLIDPNSTYALQVAEVFWEVIRLANSGYGSLDLTAALKAQDVKHGEIEAVRVEQADRSRKEWYDAQPKFHAEDSGRNPLRQDGLYGKSAQAADGDWYSSH